MNTTIIILLVIVITFETIRVVQNMIQLRRQKKLFEKNLDSLEAFEPTEEDFIRQKQFYRLGVDYFELAIRKLEEEEDEE